MHDAVLMRHLRLRQTAVFKQTKADLVIKSWTLVLWITLFILTFVLLYYIVRPDIMLMI